MLQTKPPPKGGAHARVRVLCGSKYRISAQLATILNAGPHTLDSLHHDSDEHAHAHTPNDRPCGSTRQGPDWCAAEAISVCSRNDDAAALQNVGH